MLTSIGLIMILGLLLGGLFEKIKLPSLIGMIITGIILYNLKLFDNTIISISPDLRKIALIIILTRAGLNLNIKDILKNSRAAILMCFVPALFEIGGVVLFAPMLFNVNIIDALVIGSVIAAVSPAVIVPRMLKIINEKYGTAKGIPQLILAGASVDDIVVIVLFTAFSAIDGGKKFSAISLINIPISILCGVGIGVLLGLILVKLFKKIHMRDSAKIVVLLSVSFLVIELENRLSNIIPISGLLAIMSIGIILREKYDQLSKRLSTKYNKLWVGAEIMLFVLVGATVDIKYIKTAGIMAVILVLGALIIRMVGVLFCLIKTKLNYKERVFCMIAYTPKATVQAAIGAIPLSMGLTCGEIVLVVAVISILVTAPVGAVLIDNLYKKLLTKDY